MMIFMTIIATNRLRSTISLVMILLIPKTCQFPLTNFIKVLAIGADIFMTPVKKWSHFYFNLPNENHF